MTIDPSYEQKPEGEKKLKFTLKRDKVTIK